MALAAFAVRSGEETRQVQMVCLDDLVPADDELRGIEALVDWEHVRATARPCYRPGGVGRPGLDPAVRVKLALVLAWRGLPSMRAVLKQANTDIAIRRFLGYGLTERLPDHSTFSHAQTVRFAGSSVFEQLFVAVLRQCIEAGLVGGRRMLVDATHVEADAALKSLRADLTVIDGDGDGEQDAGAFAEAPDRPRLALAEPRTGPTPKRTASNATAVSRSDPDAKLRGKPGHRTHLVHRAQVAVDPKARVIVAVEAEHATGSEADRHVRLARLRTTVLIPPQPGAKHPAAVAARERMRTPTGRDAAIDRQAHAEGAIAELKYHGLGRARCRGTRKLQLQLLIAATAINLKRLLAAQDGRAAGQTGDPRPRPAAIRALFTVLAGLLD